MYQIETFNAAGDIVARETMSKTNGARQLARIAFKMDCCVSINGRDCFTFAEVERVIARIESAVYTTDAEVAA